MADPDSEASTAADWAEASQSAECAMLSIQPAIHARADG